MKERKDLKPLNLKDLRVKSFVTHVENKMIQGGATLTCRCTLKLCH